MRPSDLTPEQLATKANWLRLIRDGAPSPVRWQQGPSLLEQLADYPNVVRLCIEASALCFLAWAILTF